MEFYVQIHILYECKQLILWRIFHEIQISLKFYALKMCQFDWIEFDISNKIKSDTIGGASAAAATIMLMHDADKYVNSNEISYDMICTIN